MEETGAASGDHAQWGRPPPAQARNEPLSIDELMKVFGVGTAEGCPLSPTTPTHRWSQAKPR